ncbi:MAG: hypothetical protein ACHQFW_07760 [Chitinophagales bacterium]
MALKQKGLLIITLALLILASCRRSLDTGWDTRFLAPIIKGDLTIYDLVPDTLAVIEDDESVTLVYQSELLDYDLTKEAIEIPDTSVEYFVSLDSLTLEDQEMEIAITLGDIANDLGFPLGTLIIASNGDSLILAEILDLSTDTTHIDATSFFQTATFSDGFLELSVGNGLPVDIVDAHFILSNSGVDGEIIMDTTFDIIPAGGVPVTYTVELDGMTVDGNLKAEIEHFGTPGSGTDSVFIDTSDALVVQLRAYDMDLIEATAIFPEQNLINNANDVEYDMGGPEFTMMGIESGLVVIYVVNNMNDTIHIVYDIPYAVDSLGNSVHILTTVPPHATVDEPFDISGYTIDLRGSDGTSVNTFYQEFSASIHYTGVATHITLEDSLHVIYGLESIVPNELRGYLGQYEIAVADTVAGLGVFDQFVDGIVHFGDINVDLEIENGLGAGGNVVINSLGAMNTETGQVIYLDCPSAIGIPIAVSRAVDNPYVPGYTTISLNSANSNINDLIEMFPDKLFYDVQMSVNPNGNEYNYQDFVIETSRLNIALNLNMPLEFFASNLTLQNEFPVTIDAGSGTEGVGTINLTLFAENTFPLDASINIVFMDDFGNKLDSIDFEGNKINPAIISEDCRVHTAVGTEIHQTVDGTLKDAILNATKATATIKFNTATIPECSEIVKIYSDYEMSIQLVGDINYTFNTTDF